MQDWLIARCTSTKVESPIEALFYGAMQIYSKAADFLPELYDWEEQVWVHPQYRADFMYRIMGEPAKGQPYRLVVELDGHDFHERTKEQAKHDRTRDRRLQAAGYAVMRFTGSEVWANPFACLDEVFSRMCQMRYGYVQNSLQGRAAITMERLSILLADTP